MPTRIVMVQFNDFVSPEDVDSFAAILQEMAQQSHGLIRMRCGRSVRAGGEGGLSDLAPNAEFCDFASVWEFDSHESLNRFLQEPFHLSHAATNFRKFVKKRFVMNF